MPHFFPWIVGLTGSRALVTRPARIRMGPGNGSHRHPWQAVVQHRARQFESRAQEWAQGVSRPAKWVLRREGTDAQRRRQRAAGRGCPCAWQAQLPGENGEVLRVRSNPLGKGIHPRAGCRCGRRKRVLCWPLRRDLCRCQANLLGAPGNGADGIARGARLIRGVASSNRFRGCLQRAWPGGLERRCAHAARACPGIHPACRGVSSRGYAPRRKPEKDAPEMLPPRHISGAHPVRTSKRCRLHATTRHPCCTRASARTGQFQVTVTGTIPA